MLYYWDSSALLALLFKEPAHHRLSRIVVEALPAYTSFFSLIEMESAYFRRVAEGSLSEESLTPLRLRAERLEAGLALIWPELETLTQARRLAFNFGLKPADSLQLAAAQNLTRGGDQCTFVCLDIKLNDAARAVGLILQPR